jgi:hypothetical protein
MRCLNENIAHQANEEDQCTGRFWEGRFKSQALLDEGALLTAMAYVDLNPIRASIASSPEESQFTSIYERIQYAKQQMNTNTQPIVVNTIDTLAQPKQLMPFVNNHRNKKCTFAIEFNLSDYLELVDSSGRIIRDDKAGAIPDNLLPILTRINLSTVGWLMMVQELEDKFFYAVGQDNLLEEFGQTYRLKKSPKGSTAAQQCYLKVA